VTSGVTRDELENSLENFKTSLLGTLSLQLDTLKFKKKQEYKNVSLSIFFPRCRKRHSLKECPLDSIEICVICIGENSMEHCSSLTGIKEVYQEGNQATKQLCTLVPRTPLQPTTPCMSSNPTS
jgi:hypothetical protein